MQSLLNLLLTLLALTLAAGCAGAGSRAGGSLKPGLNYLQPLKWRMTYRYRVQEIRPKNKLVVSRDSKLNPGIPAVGRGTYEVWLTGPRQGEEIRQVKRVVASPDPTKVSKGRDTDVEFVYYDFAPDGYLPRELSATVTWEFISLEPYTLWEGMSQAKYDKKSELYRTHTKEEKPILFHHDLVKVAKKCVDPDHPDDYMRTALNCYNYILANFSYDFEKMFLMPYYGLQGQADSFRCWENKQGKCDELTNVYVAMLRSVGIPARPVAGWVHDPTPTWMGGHSWAEFYLPDVGWVPVDPTWGPEEGLIEPQFSTMGFARKIPKADYWFGKHDPFRLVLYKDWNYRLTPAPRTPGVSDREVWNTGVAERSSGVEQVIGGWPGLPGIESEGGMGWARAEDMATTKFDIEIELVGVPTKLELDALQKEIEAEGANLIRMPGAPRRFPIDTTAAGHGEMAI